MHVVLRSERDGTGPTMSLCSSLAFVIEGKQERLLVFARQYIEVLVTSQENFFKV